MAHAKPNHQLRRFGRVLARVAACGAILALALAWNATSARADGDPASDVLATQPLFLPQDAGLPAERSAQLAALLQAAHRSGYPIRVALITSSTDLGSITELWRQPQTYARFLGQELSLTYRGPLLVVMPNGLGLYGFPQPLAAEKAAVAGIQLSAGGAQLGAATLTAVQRLAAKAGHPLPIPSATTPPTSHTPSDPLPWIVLAIGGAIIVAAWVISLRARPLRLRGPRIPST